MNNPEGKFEERVAIVAYLRDTDRIGGSRDVHLMASLLADAIEQGAHDPGYYDRTKGGVKLDD